MSTEHRLGLTLCHYVPHTLTILIIYAHMTFQQNTDLALLFATMYHTHSLFLLSMHIGHVNRTQTWPYSLPLCTTHTHYSYYLCTYDISQNTDLALLFATMYHTHSLFLLSMHIGHFNRTQTWPYSLPPCTTHTHYSYYLCT